MSEWIKELKDSAKRFGGFMEGDLHNTMPSVGFYVDKYPKNDQIWLQGQFSFEQLQSLVNHMKKYKGE